MRFMKSKTPGEASNKAAFSPIGRPPVEFSGRPANKKVYKMWTGELGNTHQVFDACFPVGFILANSDGRLIINFYTIENNWFTAKNERLNGGLNGIFAIFDTDLGSA